MGFKSEKETNFMLIFRLKLRQACDHLSLVKDLSTDDVFDDKDDVALELSMFKLDLDDTMNDKNIQALAKDTELQYDASFISTKLDCLMKKLDFIVNHQGEKCSNLNDVLFFFFRYSQDCFSSGVVVSSWVGMLNIVRHHLKRYQIRSQTISGEIKIADRQAVVQAFNNDENPFMVRRKRK